MLYDILIVQEKKTYYLLAFMHFVSDVELPPVATFLRSGIVAINELCNTNRSTAADLIEFLTIRQRNSATDSIEVSAVRSARFIVPV